MSKHLCPVCGKHEFEEEYERCPFCGWWYDMVQEKYPDEDGGSNYLSLNQAREMYRRGRIDMIRHPHVYDENAERLDGADGIIAGLTPAEMWYMGEVIGDRVFFAKRPSVHELKDINEVLKRTRCDREEDDRIRRNLIQKIDSIE